MARPKEFDVDKALSAAMETFWEHGFEATSICDLTERMGVQKASLYGTFGDKRQLFLAALAKYAQDDHRGLKQRFSKARSVKQAFRELFEEIVERTTSDSPQSGCFCVNAATELAQHDEQVAALLDQHFRAMERVLKSAIERGQAAGEIEARISAGPVAKHLTVMLLGLSVAAKLGSNDRRISDSARVALSLLGV